jgi:O-antigen/teichoic acid export membrane protein
MDEGEIAAGSTPAGTARSGISALFARGPLRLARLLATRWLGTGAQFFLNIVLGRVMGAEGLGIFYLFQAWYRWLSQIGGLGLPLHCLRSLSVFEGRGDRGASQRFLKIALGLVLGLAVVIGLAVLPFAPQMAGSTLGSQNLAYVLQAAVVAGALWVSLRIVGSAFKARSRPELALVLEFSSLPVGLLLFVGASLLFGSVVSPPALIGASVLVLAVSVAVSLFLLRDATVETQSETPLRVGELFPPRTMGSFWGIGLVNSAISNAPLLLMPQFAAASEIALFGVSTRLVALAAAIQDALVSDFSPRFARHHEGGDATALRSAFRRSQLYSIVTYAPILLLFLTLPRLILGLFGPEFTAGVEFLTIVAIGQGVSSASGLVGSFLSMTHRQAVLLRINTVALVVMIVLILVLGSSLGAVGVAWAYAATVAIRNLLGLVVVRATIRELRPAPAG